MIKIEVKDLHKSYNRNGSELGVLDGISLAVSENEFISVIGPSGCGKSTLLRIIAGLLQQDSGTAEISGSIAYLQQSGPLMPWRNVLENVILPIEIKSGGRPDYKEELKILMEEFGLRGFEKSMPHEISGGMAKRAALLRMYLEEKDLLLMDEPFSSLDAITRKSMRQWLLKIWNNHKKGVIFITHDIEEALLLSDRVYVMGQRPASIIASMVPSVQRPRSHDDIYLPKFISQKKQIENMLIS